MNQAKEPMLYRMIRGTVDLIYPDIEVVGLENLPEEPCILVGNHCQMNGPIISEIRIPGDHYTWCISQMMERKEVAAYAFADFWAQKPKWNRWAYWLFSRCIPALAAFVMSSARTIPVYRDSRCITTFRKTMEKLQEGCSIVIFPEHDVPYNSILCEFESRFIDVARLYYRKTGKALRFVPMYLAPKIRKVIIGMPIVFRPEQPLDEERERIRLSLMQAITELAEALPLHTVVPYLNLPKKEYPRNRLPESEGEKEEKTI